MHYSSLVEHQDTGGTHTYMQAKHSYLIKKMKINLFKEMLSPVNLMLTLLSFRLVPCHGLAVASRNHLPDHIAAH